jgi:hypothetical protein
VPDLKNKTILILSPQAWGKMFVSKHHYAIELAKLGNNVYFLNPPDQLKADRAEAIEISLSDVHPNLFLIDHKLFFPYRLKFRLLPIFHWLMQFHVKRLLKKIGKPVDIVWSFDLGNLYPFRLFEKHSYKIFHPVDEPLNSPAINAASGASIIFSVTTEILDKYKNFNMPKHFINHGVTSDFLSEPISALANNPIRVGFSGNLLRNDIDRNTLLQIVEENKQCIFEFWGSYEAAQSNIGGAIDSSTTAFIAKLKSSRHVILHGAIPSSALAKALIGMDIFLICYDVQRDQSKGTNYHKVMEYLAAGKIIVSNNVSTYKDKPDLVQMVLERDHNKKLPILFKDISYNLKEFNSKERMSARRAFAIDNGYNNQLGRIAKLIGS